MMSWVRELGKLHMLQPSKAVTIPACAFVSLLALEEKTQQVMTLLCNCIHL